ncbi:uncharacterized protein LOC105828000 [Monomorium pharaonis]|uniref:uncharacterized protein LOC105828000 n=1 Tax=Monomorium pharaonis TaxID=307658 RepID=UPI0017471A59|nr:uncharacterized protein LOC105828000 [Monomorium pharaonis]
MIIFGGVQLWSQLIYVLLSVNVSRPRRLQIATEYFIDQERYFYLLFFHINTVMFIGCVVMVATGTMLVAYLHHACGMFKIASYRIEKAIQIYEEKRINLKNEFLAHKTMIHAVDIHRKALTFSNDLISTFEISFMLLIVIGVLSLSLNIYRVFQLLLFGYNKEEFLVNLAVAFVCTVYMFTANFMGQQIIDHNNHIYVTAYNVRWYITPLRIQKLILFLLQRGNKSFGLCVGGLFVASIECFATLANASLSYFTVMYSMQS